MPTADIRSRRILATGLRVWICATVAFALAASVTHATVEVTLKKSFIEKYKDRATIDTQYVIDKAHKKPNAPAQDGDMHIAGRADEIGLPAVAEIMNAKYEGPSVNLVHDKEGTGSKVPITGVWRLWAEHGGDATQNQGDPLSAFDTTNPDHVFELHPITSIGGKGIQDSFKPILGFTYKVAADSFDRYENLRCHLTCGPSATTITMSMAGYNYVEFVMELLENPTHILDDGGASVFASVYTTDGELLVQKRRMILVKGTVPETVIKALHKGDKLQVLGVPRVDLSLVSWRCSHATEKPEALSWNLPYEIVVVAVLE